MLAMKLTPKRFRVQNYRNINDSGWIPLERVTSFVGRNEAGKTALLKALHKFNPATAAPYEPQIEFPRDRFAREFKDGGEWPVCSVEFELAPGFRTELKSRLGGATPPATATATRYYDETVSYDYDTEVTDSPVPPDDLVKKLKSVARAARRIEATTEADEAAVQQERQEVLSWEAEKRTQLNSIKDLKSATGVEVLNTLQTEANSLSNPSTADVLEPLIELVEEVLEEARTQPLPDVLDEAIGEELPVFIYFENYGILDSAVYLPRFLEELEESPSGARVRTINAMFKHVGLTAEEITTLGQQRVTAAEKAGTEVTTAMIQADQKAKELRAVKLNSASLDITKRFGEWFGQRRHAIRYSADGDYFRIWVSDDRRPGVDIELESRSKGFQWFFSFYLVFLVESLEGHKDAVLLLDEPGLHLHPTAQQELLTFFENLAEKNPLLYSTHSPFLIDGERIHRVRPVTEDAEGHSRISLDGWPRDRDTIFPLQAAAGYAMVRGLFRHKKNVLVEGMSEYLYLHSLNLQCRAAGKTSLPEDVYITPCGGTKLVGHLASLFLGQGVRPVVLLDDDDAGRARQSALMKELYAGYERAVLMLDEVLGGDNLSVEDLVGEKAVLSGLKKVLGKKLSLNADDRQSDGLVEHVKAAAERQGVELPEGWKPEVARYLAIEWSTTKAADMPTEVLDRAAKLFSELTVRFSDIDAADTDQD